MKCVVLFSAGIGDAILLIPLIKQLRSSDALVDGVFTTGCETIFEGSDLLNKLIRLNGSKLRLLSESLRNKNKYDKAYLNMFAAGRTTLLLTQTIAHEVCCNGYVKNLPYATQKRLRWVEPIEGIHDATQNLRLYLPDAKDNDICMDDFHLKTSLPEVELPSAPFFTVQLSTGNNILKYKNWPLQNWIEFLKMLTNECAGHHIVLLGDRHETPLSNKVMNMQIERVHSVCGDTDIRQAMAYIKNSDCFIGLDGGLMHLAAALDKPTFTLWGISDPKMYGYEQFDPARHRIIKAKAKTSHSWLSPLREDALKQDHYLDSLSPVRVGSEFLSFFRKLND